MVKLTEINVYPIKSSRRIALQEGLVTRRGLEWDRRWMLVDANSKFVTAREYPRLAMVQARIEGDHLVVEGPGLAPLNLLLTPQGGQRESVQVWRDQVQALAVGEAADRWFSGYLGIPCRLVRMPDDWSRQVDLTYAAPGDEVSFADGFPLLLISEGSLADLNSRLETPVEMRRFRPNIVVNAEQAFAEDGWERIRVGEVEFEVAKPCSRCIFTTIDPDKGVKDPEREPLRTLSTYRRAPAGQVGVFFGQNLIPRNEGKVRLGDQVEVLKIKPT